MNWTPSHEQVDLPDLGFTVDRGLEDLIRACWRRGIATDVCCIGEPYKRADIGFFDGRAARRWEELTGHRCEWIDDEEVATVAEARFDRSEIPGLCAALRLERPLD